MNILLQIAGLFVMIVIFIFYFNDRKAAVKSNKIFIYQGIAICVSIFLDITSIISFNIPGWTYSFLSYATGRLYLVSVLVVVCCGFLYVIYDTKYSRKKINVFKIISFSVLGVASVLVLTLPINIVYDPDGLNDYTEGWPIILTYAFTGVYMIATISVAIIKRKQMYRKRFIGVCIFLSLWVFGAAIQGIVNYAFGDLGVIILSVSFAESLGSLVIYIMLENPAWNLDRITGALTQRAFEEFIDDCYYKNIPVELLLIDYDSAIASSLTDYNKFAKSITETIKSFGVKKIFKNDKEKFIVVRNVTGNDDLYGKVNQLKEIIYRKNNIKSEIPFKVMYFNDISLFYCKEDLNDAINYLTDKKSFEKEIIFVNNDLADKIHQKFIMEKKCDIAFNDRRVEIYLQPIFSNHEKTFTCAEALVRLKDDEGNLIYPTDFIEDMEKDGRIVELGKMVFEDICKFISSNNMKELGLEYIEINLSTIQCMQDNLASSYISIMEKYKVNPRYINLEITETAKSTRITLLRNMQILKDYGVTFSLDDFGTGNSNLNYIVEMPVDIVKFDKGMVDSYFDNKIASYVLNSSINMIKGLGQKIVFEGIEKEEQINMIKDMDVDYVQGYYYSEPVNKTAFIEFVKMNNKKLESNNVQ